jgi:2-polyprenyl-6-methoxyphenol hydroxylase-like FAD-dependent oxidoreductase
MSRITHVGVIGAGLMGHGIAQIFALRGYSVVLMDVSEELLSKALEGIRSNLTLMAEHGIVPQEDIEPALSRIKTTVDMAEAPRRPFSPPTRPLSASRRSRKRPGTGIVFLGPIFGILPTLFLLWR